MTLGYAIEDCDVAVLGGGPAGCSAAVALARRGHSVTLLDAGRRRAVMGEILTSSAKPLLQWLGLLPRLDAQQYASMPGMISAWGDARPHSNDSYLNPYGAGWLLERSAFDDALLECCGSAGVVVFADSPAIGCRQTQGGWQVERSRNADRVHARFVVDATGRGAQLLGRHAGGLQVVDELVALAWIGSSSSERSHSWALIESAPAGWWYSARLPGARSVALYFTDADLVTGDDGDLAAFMRARLDQAPLTQTHIDGTLTQSVPVKLPAMSVRRTEVAGTNWMLAGDAAMSIDPLSGQGIQGALECGARAAEVAARALTGEPEALRGYGSWLDARFHAYMKQRSRYYRMEQRWPDSPFWQRRHAAH